MSIFDKLFGTQPAAPAPAASQPTPPGNIPPFPNQVTAQSDGTAPNGVIPAGTPEASNTSPLDQFNSLWQPNENPAEPQPLINVDPKSLAEAASKTDFTKMLKPEQMQAIASGGEGAVAAFAQALNQVAQGVYAQSAFATTKIVEQAVAKARDQFNADIPNHVKKLQVSESLRSENPALSHPAASPILGAIESQLTMKHPQASSAEITKMAKQYLETFASAIGQPARDAADARAAADNKGSSTDWSTFL